jgi:hypothetical protein
MRNEMSISCSSTGGLPTLIHAVSLMRKEKKMLPKTFIPHPYSVILGTGKVNESIGNRRLRILVDIELNNYERAQSLREKSYVIARVMETIQAACVVVGFVRSEGGSWYEVSDSDYNNVPQQAFTSIQVQYFQQGGTTKTTKDIDKEQGRGRT